VPVHALPGVPPPVTGIVVNVAVTVPAEVREQAPVPVHAPDHPVKIEPEAGVAVADTVDPVFAEHDVGLQATVPEPVPAFAVVMVKVVGAVYFTR
jgi:hypothetical protein